MKNIFGIIALLAIMTFSGCSIKAEDRSVIYQENGPIIYKALGDQSKYSEIACAPCDTDAYPSSVESYTIVSFAKRDTRFKFFYKNIKFPAGSRDISVHVQAGNKYQDIKIPKVPFEENVKYLIKHVAYNNFATVWIEKEDGTVVAGEKAKKKL